MPPRFLIALVPGSLLAVMMVSMNAAAAQADEPQRLEYAIVVHGGAGSVPQDPELREQRRAGLEQALRAGQEILAAGGSALDAVEAAVRVLENAPAFNAGRGACLTSAGRHELDASIMDGKTHAGAGVGGVTTVKNPVSLARLVMTETPHILLAYDGAEAFADQMAARPGIERVENSYFFTERQQRLLERAQRRQTSQLDLPADPNEAMGTVGCVALDKDGNLAAATSTGGRTNKLPGRIGDSPILSTGNYADNRSCAASGTGVGEDFIRYAACFEVGARMRFLGETLEQAVHAVLHNPEQQVRGGLIAVDRQGAISMQFNTPSMSRGAADSSGRWEIHVAE